MTKDVRKSGEKEVDLSATDVGRYLKKLASLSRDKKTGNQALSAALEELSTFLIESRAKTTRDALAATGRSEATQPDLDTLDPTTWTHSEIREYLANEHITKKALISIGFNRLGIPISRLQKMGREELLETLAAAVEHEESIKILSNQAELDGTKRTS